MKHFLILFFVIFSFLCKGQETVLKDLKTSHRFNQGVQIVSFTPAFQFNNLTGQETIFGLGANLGYSYFPLKNWSIGVNFSYGYLFITPKENRAHDITAEILTKYYFATKRNVSFFIGIGGALVYFDYKTFPENPNVLFYDDPVDGEIHTHKIPLLKPQAGISFKLLKQFTIQINIGYNHSFYKLKGNGRNLIQPLFHYCSLNYHFSKKKEKVQKFKF